MINPKNITQQRWLFALVPKSDLKGYTEEKIAEKSERAVTLVML